MSKKLKFKVGDQVRIVRTPLNGETATISRVKGDTVQGHTLIAWDYELMFDEANSYTHHGGRDGGKAVYRYYDEDNLELVSATTKYKPGDMVTVRDNLNRWDIYHMADGNNPMEATEQMLSKCGKVVKIKSVTKTGKYMIEGSIFPWVDEMFEPDVVKPEKTEKREPKVGDRIRMTSNWCSAKVGMVGTIINFSTGTVNVRFDVKFPGGHDCAGKCEYGFGHNVLPKHFEIIGEEKPHLICSVKFTENGKLYCYLTDDTTITVGSEVKVPVGKTDREKTATVERIGYYTEADAPYTVSEMKKVIGKATPTFDWDAFKKTKIIVKLDTKEKFDAFMKECDERGIKWHNGDKASATAGSEWTSYENKTSVVYGYLGSGIGYANIRFYTKELPDAVVYDYKLPESKPEVKPEPKPEPETKRKFKVGDRVKVVKSNRISDSDDKGYEGTVVKVENCGYDYTVDFGKNYEWTHGGHMGTGKLSYRHYDENYLEAVKEKPKYYNGKVVCTENKIDDKDFTVGEIYEVIDGKIIDNKTHKRPATKYRLSSDFDHLDKYFEDWHYTFRPVERVTKETKLKRGDRIVMRDDLAVDRWYGLTWYSDMEHDMSGEIVTVTEGTDYQGDCRVKAPKSGRDWYVTTEMIAYKIID